MQGNPAFWCPVGRYGRAQFARPSIYLAAKPAFRAAVFVACGEDANKQNIRVRVRRQSARKK